MTIRGNQARTLSEVSFFLHLAHNSHVPTPGNTLSILGKSAAWIDWARHKTGATNNMHEFSGL